MSEQIFLNEDTRFPIDSLQLNSLSVTGDLSVTGNLDSNGDLRVFSNLRFPNGGATNLNKYEQATATVTMTDGLAATYSQSLIMERIGNYIKLTLRAVSNAVGNTANVTASSAIPVNFRPASTVQEFIVRIVNQANPNGVAARLIVNSTGIIQIANVVAGTLFGAGTLSYNDLTVVYNAV